MNRIFASCPPGLEDLLVSELAPWSPQAPKATAGGVFIDGDLATAYRICYRSRLASRVFWQLSEFPAPSDDALYAALRAVPWEQHLKLENTFAFRVTARQAFSKNTAFLAQRAKDALADSFTEMYGRRPDVQRQRPDLQFHLHLQKGQGTLYLDLAGAPLHERGYRVGAGEAPLKETLAAAILCRLGWPDSADRILDPMCGSGTFLVEAVEMALKRPAGLHRTAWGFQHWLQHDEILWEREVAAACEGMENPGDVVIAQGRDIDPTVLELARQNISAAGLEACIALDEGTFEGWSPQIDSERTLVVTNPPYGERLSERSQVLHLCGVLGDWLLDKLPGARAGVLVPDETVGKAIGYHTSRRYNFRNGPLSVALWCFDVGEDKRRTSAFSDSPTVLSQVPEDLFNRLKKNVRRLEKWRKQNAIEAYRIYDADLPEYACAIDRYGDCLHVQEYAPPADLPEGKAQKRLEEVILTLRKLFGVGVSQIFVKQRRRQRRRDQYQKGEERFGRQDGRLQVTEHGLTFEVDLAAYLDTGLFLDHRPARRWVRDMSAGKRVLNLFCYTGSVSVYAAAGGAQNVVSVDMSKTYLQWARRNMALNGLDKPQHGWIRADVLQWVQDNEGEHYDLIFCDPPSFSNSKSMVTTWDVQRDHADLLRRLMRQLNPGGTLLFSTNLRRFRLDDALLDGFDVEDLSQRSLDPDFARRPNIHRIFRFRHGDT
jgi:23S rRNA (guanine2445-N2)-methyltransferase / 23S rRNA (guanine2069-N7)-methyltransferase